MIGTKEGYKSVQEAMNKKPSGMSTEELELIDNIVNSKGKVRLLT